MVKLYLDSRARSFGTHENFTVALPTTLDLKTEHLALLDTCCIPNTWKTVGAHNKFMYLLETASGTETYRRVALVEGNYNAISLADAFQTALNQGKSLSGSYSVDYDFRANRIGVVNSLASGESFAIWGADYLKANVSLWNSKGSTQITHGTRDSGWTLGFNSANAPTNHSVTSELQADSAPNLHQHHNVYIHSDMGLPGEAYGPGGQQDIVRRCVITAGPGEINISSHSTAFDTIKIAPGTLSSLSFRLAGYDGETIDLNGHPWSFSLCLYPESE